MKAILPPYFTRDLYPVILSRQLGVELRTRRESLGLSAYALAKDAQVTDQNILNIEQGTSSPSLVTLALICVRFQVTCSKFIGAAEELPRQTAAICKGTRRHSGPPPRHRN